MADTKVTGLPANTTPVSTDVIPIIDDPAGTAVSQKITLADLMALFANPVSDDGDGLGTAALRWADVFLASGGVINFNGGNVTLSHSAGALTVAGGKLQLAAGTTSLAPLKFAVGTNLTTPEVGAIELDANCFYATTDAGNRGIIPVVHFIRADATRTLPNDTNLNAIFNSPANGTLTLETGTYRFNMLAVVTAMSTTSGNALINIRGAGTATIGAWLWRTAGLDTTGANTISGDAAAYHTSEATAASAVTAAVNTVMRWHAHGSFEVTGAGTIIPSIDLVTAIATAVVAVGSFFECWRIGSTSVVSVGQTS